MEVKLPFLGDGIDSAVVLSVLVKVGDKVEKESTLLELETDKAVAPVPSPAKGEVEDILVTQGDSVSSGAVVIKLKSDQSETVEAAPAAPTPSVAPQVAVQQPTAPVQVQGSAPNMSFTYQSASGSPPPASPSIRKLAKEIGLDLGRIQGSGNGGRILIEDVRNMIAKLQHIAFNQSTTPESPSKQPSSTPIDFSKFGATKTEKLSTMRQMIGKKMQESWQTIPHVTQQDEATISGIHALRKKYNPSYEKKGAKLTVTVFAILAICKALKEFPHFNASLDPNGDALILKEYVHIGVAVDTPAGLIVPVLKDVDKKSIESLAIELNEIAEKARNRRISLEDIQGGSFTLSNLGSLGVGYFTPIINTPEVAILGMGRGKDKNRLPLCLSYDHRVIDGADGARFIKSVIHHLENFDENELKRR